VDHVAAELEKLISRTAKADQAAGLRAVRAVRDMAERLEAQYVQQLRAQGWSWQEIGDLLGTSRQSAHKKHARWRRGAAAQPR